ncbi:Crp/Fnr family transcriptional regulator [Actinosynnema pretiosum subsp. pretiosum]|uniref:Crp/Fnr family transcriptional regulator n=2 Tax=Actinosynnema TaxID=40566 RepID=A0AA45LDC3_9PSEU|nr:Crp/Fnr family transcriptional regulator [Actinosynnema mirum]ACU34595.1 putative transcriptional regulator, Crp/Fnr family [Actinosynnema mirum DSM 43827]AXX27958.1 transcriptional regulator, Crp/Fnr family [Actinosynnema pretiosum subsp. pretiosum]QUF07625.1 Crp/Fnr family transcriptional regulator [Actinosynnema pretiosum subsp. pretiosum]
MDTFEDSLDPEEFGRLLRLGTEVSYRRGNQLMRHGERGDCVMVLRSGQVRVVKPEGDGQSWKLLGVRGAGELLGERAVLWFGERTATVEARGPVLAVKVARGVFQDFLREHPRSREVCTRLLAIRTDRYESRSLSGKPADRVRQALIELAEPRGAWWEVPLTQVEIGMYVQVSKAVVQRTVRKLRGAGLVGKAGRGSLPVPCLPCLRKAQKYGQGVRGCRGDRGCAVRLHGDSEYR